MKKDEHLVIGVVKKDIICEDGTFVKKGTEVVGYYLPYGEEHYIVGELIEVDGEYTVLDFWYPISHLLELKEVDDFKSRLKKERLELADKLNKLNTFMSTDKFYNLPREDKDLLYDQNIHMTKYLQVLGKRCERLGIVLDTKLEGKNPI